MLDHLLQYAQTHYLDLFGLLIGLIYLYLEFTAKKSMWIASLIMAVLYLYIFYHSQMYAMSIVYCYFFAASIHGWIQWNEQSSITIQRMPPQQIYRVILFFIIACITIYLLLKSFTINDVEITMGDTIATALLLLAQGDYASSVLFLIYFIVSIFGLRHWIQLANQAQS